LFTTSRLKPRIQIQNVTHRYRVIRERPDSLREAFTKILRHHQSVEVFEALKSVSLEVAEGEVLGIIGRNGSGKSTLLKLIAGVFKPTEGQVHLEGTVAPLIELGAGFHPDLTGRENILLNGLLLGLSKADIRRREERIIEFAEIGNFIDSPVKQYSSGMFMRLAFAIATEVDPDILLVDEILAVGDAEFQEKCYARLLRSRNQGKTIVMVTHDLGSVKRLCTRAILIGEGKVRAEGSVQQVLRRYAESLSRVPDYDFKGEAQSSGRAPMPAKEGSGR